MELIYKKIELKGLSSPELALEEKKDNLSLFGPSGPDR